MIELKPCPFCGREAKLFVSDNGVCVRCTRESCGCRTRYYDDVSSYIVDGWREYETTAVDDAIEAWNRRTEDERTD